MAILKTKDFIQNVLITEIGSVSGTHPYLSFIIMSTSIEFLGKCLKTEVLDWNADGSPKVDFEHAIKNIPSFQKYETYLESHKLYGSFRCGLAHSASPKRLVTLSSGEEAAHLSQNDGRLNLKVEEFYRDFKEACEYVVNKLYPANDKMELPFLEIPDVASGSTTSASGSTQTHAYTSPTVIIPPSASGVIPRR